VLHFSTCWFRKAFNSWKDLQSHSRLGLCSATDIARLDAFVRRSKKLGYCRPETPAVAELFEKADDDLFERINTNSHHALYQFPPPKTAHSYNTRPRHHNFTLFEKSTDLNHRDFFTRMLYKYAYWTFIYWHLLNIIACIIFTARCTLVESAYFYRMSSVCPSVCL